MTSRCLLLGFGLAAPLVSFVAFLAAARAGSRDDREEQPS